jgi:hypothetical protein
MEGKDGGTITGGSSSRRIAIMEPNPMEEAGSSTDSREGTGVADIGGRDGTPKGNGGAGPSPRDAGGSDATRLPNTGRPRYRDSSGHRS